MNSIVTTQNDQLVTTTLDIAEGTGNEHASVILMVRKYQTDLEEFGLVDFKSTSSDGRPTEYAQLNEQQATLILTYMRNSEIVRTFKKRLVKDFWEMRKALAAQPAIDPMKVLNDPAAMRGLLLGYTEKVIALESVVAQQAPKVAAFDRFATVVEGSMCLTNAAKSLQLQPKKFMLWMQEHQWVYRRAGGSGLIGYQNRIQSGHLEHKVTTVERSDGTSKQVEQVLVTAKGLARLATELGHQ